MLSTRYVFPSCPLSLLLCPLKQELSIPSLVPVVLLLHNADLQVYKELMPDPKPARTCVGVAQLPAGGTDVEIEFVAYDG
jgi:hypothetical protein